MNLPALAIGLVVIFIGALSCFFGYRIFKIILAIWGFILGAIGGALLGAIFGMGQTVYMVLGGLLGGIIGAVLLVVVYFIGIFILGALAGFLLAYILGMSFNLPTHPAILLVTSVLGGILAIIFQKFMIIFSTALAGAWSMVLGIFILTGWIPFQELFLRPKLIFGAGGILYITLLAWIILAIAGTVIQFTLTGKKKKDNQSEIQAPSQVS